MGMQIFLDLMEPIQETITVKRRKQNEKVIYQPADEW